MLSETRNKAIGGWFVVKDATTGEWRCQIGHPGKRHAGLEQVFDYRTATERARELNKRDKGPDVCDIYQA